MMETVAGVDGWRKGWVAVVSDGVSLDVVCHPTMADLVEDLRDAAAIVVDIPIGLPVESGRRSADDKAKRFLGARASSVFFTPPRPVLEAPSYEEARAVARRRYGIGVMSQAYRGLRSKIFEVDGVAAGDGRVREGHPEVSFAALAGRPLSHHKRSWNGREERRTLLARAGLEPRGALRGTAGSVPVDDVLDAAVLAWTARRVVRGVAGSLPDPPEMIAGRPVAIWF